MSLGSGVSEALGSGRVLPFSHKTILFSAFVMSPPGFCSCDTGHELTLRQRGCFLALMANPSS